VRLQRQGDLAGAIASYQAAIKANPAHLGAISNLGAALVAMGRYEEAITQYSRALALSDHPLIRRNLALAYYKSARMGDAIRELDRLRAGNPADVDLAILLADCHFRLGEDRKVVEVLAPFAERNPENLGVAYLLGTALIREGEAGRGQVLVDRILRQGESAEAHLMLGTAHLRAARLQDAAGEFSKAVELSPKLAGAWSQLGLVRLRMNEAEAAAEAFRRELELNANDFDANFYLGVILRESGRPQEALARIEHAGRLRPDSLKARYQLGSLYLQLRRYEDARRVLEPLVERAPKFPEAHTALATVYLRLGRPEEAARHRQIARELLAATPGTAPPVPYGAATAPEPR
jgi:tetratricopeptide (TPR) repeat protein